MYKSASQVLATFSESEGLRIVIEFAGKGARMKLIQYGHSGTKAGIFTNFAGVRPR